jgi:excisionase family DNA binding protein
MEDSYTAGEAARILRVTESRVRQLLGSGELEGTRDLNGRWRVPQRAVHARRDARGVRDTRGGDLESRERSQAGDSLGELIERIATLERALGRAETRGELTEQAHSTTQAALEHERARVERLEAELEEMRRRGFWRRVFG